jgi:hypothetical protein
MSDHELDKYKVEGADYRAQYARDNWNRTYTLGPRVFREGTSAHEWRPGEPTTRRLRIFAVDPAALVRDGKYATIEIPWEPLQPGPVGTLFAVETDDPDRGDRKPPADLDNIKVLLSNGIAPSDSNREFHSQMVYGVASVVHRSFRRALGRQIPWPFPPHGGVSRLRIRPFAREQQNAWYDPNEGTLNFGYFPAAENPFDRTLPRGTVYTALSHDIVCHEMTHAMLDALRANFAMQTSNDMSGFHEGFSDLVALFHHFQHRDALRSAMARCRGDIRKSQYLSSIGQQFGRATGSPEALRSAANEKLRYDPKLLPHQMGELLMAAVYDAFCTVYDRKTASIMRLATGGTGRLPEGELPEALVEVLASRAHNLANEFLMMLIRAVDYLPPADVRLGEYLRAIISADSALVPDDPWNYREALIDSFRQRGIYPRDVDSLNEDSLLWLPPGGDAALGPVRALSFKEICFQGDPGTPVTVGEQIAQACELGEFVTANPDCRDKCLAEFGLVVDGDARLEGDRVTLPQIESVRTLRRVGPDGQTIFDTVAEILQVRTVRPRDGKPGFDIYGGCTVILDSRGNVRSVIRKSVVGERRIDRRLDYLESDASKGFWRKVKKGGEERYVPRDGSPFFALCGREHRKAEDDRDDD